MDAEPTIERWAEVIDQAIAACSNCIVDRVVVLSETSSTQDAALRAFDGEHGVAVIAHRQTSGRGQRGNRWEDGDGQTLAMSLALPMAGLDALRLAAVGGLAALESVIGVCSTDARLLVKWPNDVVVRSDSGDRKLAGVLVEVRDGAAVIGIGINTRTRAWDGLEAVSIEDLKGETNRVVLACALIGQVSRWLVADDQTIRAAWSKHDAMVGTERSFVVDNERVLGEVISLDPFTTIRVRTQAGDRELDVRVTRNG